MRDWDESRGRRDDELGPPSRQLRYFIRAYVIHKDARGAFVAWARTQKFYNMGTLEDAGDLAPELMLRERGWSSAWRDFNNPFFHLRCSSPCQTRRPRRTLAWCGVVAALLAVRIGST